MAESSAAETSAVSRATLDGSVTAVAAEAAAESGAFDEVGRLRRVTPQPVPAAGLTLSRCWHWPNILKTMNSYTVRE